MNDVTYPWLVKARAFYALAPELSRITSTKRTMKLDEHGLRFFLSDLTERSGSKNLKGSTKTKRERRRTSTSTSTLVSLANCSSSVGICGWTWSTIAMDRTIDAPTGAWTMIYGHGWVTIEQAGMCTRRSRRALWRSQSACWSSLRPSVRSSRRLRESWEGSREIRMNCTRAMGIAVYRRDRSCEGAKLREIERAFVLEANQFSGKDARGACNRLCSRAFLPENRGKRATAAQ